MQLSRALLPILAERPEARLMNIGSAVGGIGLPGHAAYGASKFGLRGFSEALRRELAGGSVRIQYLAPRVTRTPFNGAEVEHFNASTGAACDPPETVARVAQRMLERGGAERSIGLAETVGARLSGLLGARMDGAFAGHRRALVASGAAPSIGIGRSS
jgi:short-subunit dehydrogenase